MSTFLIPFVFNLRNWFRLVTPFYRTGSGGSHRSSSSYGTGSGGSVSVLSLGPESPWVSDQERTSGRRRGRSPTFEEGRFVSLTPNVAQ